MNDEIKISDEARECPHCHGSLERYEDPLAVKLLHQRDEEIREFKKDKERLQCLIDLVGSCRQASDSDVKIFEDDATHTYFIETFSGARRTGQWFAQSVRGCLDAAMSKETKGEQQ